MKAVFLGAARTSIGSFQGAFQAVCRWRQIALGSGLPQHVPGQTVNRVGGSGLRAILSALHEWYTKNSLPRLAQPLVVYDGAHVTGRVISHGFVEAETDSPLEGTVAKYGLGEDLRSCHRSKAFRLNFECCSLDLPAALA